MVAECRSETDKRRKPIQGTPMSMLPLLEAGTQSHWEYLNDCIEHALELCHPELRKLDSVTTNSCLFVVEDTSPSISFWTFFTCSLSELCRLSAWFRHWNVQKWGTGDVGAQWHCLLYYICLHKNIHGFKFDNHFFSQRHPSMKIVLAKCLELQPWMIECSSFSRPSRFSAWEMEGIKYPQLHKRQYLVPKSEFPRCWLLPASLICGPNPLSLEQRDFE